MSFNRDSSAFLITGQNEKLNMTLDKQSQSIHCVVTKIGHNSSFLALTFLLIPFLQQFSFTNRTNGPKASRLGLNFLNIETETNCLFIHLLCRPVLFVLFSAETG